MDFNVVMPAVHVGWSSLPLCPLKGNPPACTHVSQISWGHLLPLATICTSCGLFSHCPDLQLQAQLRAAQLIFLKCP